MGYALQQAISGKPFDCPCCKKPVRWKKNICQRTVRRSLLAIFLILPFWILANVAYVSVIPESVGIAISVLGTFLCFAMVMGFFCIELEQGYEADVAEKNSKSGQV
jgi:hypothetical protein